MSSSEWYEKTGAEAHNRVSAVTDLPALVVPAGFTREGIPISLEFLGRPYSEPTLIRLPVDTSTPPAIAKRLLMHRH